MAEVPSGAEVPLEPGADRDRRRQRRDARREVGAVRPVDQVPRGVDLDHGDERAALPAQDHEPQVRGERAGLGPDVHVAGEVVQPELRLDAAADAHRERGLDDEHPRGLHADAEAEAERHAVLVVPVAEQVGEADDVEVEAVTALEQADPTLQHAPAHGGVDVTLEGGAVDLPVLEVEGVHHHPAPKGGTDLPRGRGHAVRLLGQAQDLRDGGRGAAGERVLVVAEVRLELGDPAAGGEVPLDGVEPRVSARRLRGGGVRRALDAVQTTLDRAHLRLPAARRPPDGRVHVALADAGAGGRDRLDGVVAVAGAERELVGPDRAVEHLATRRLALAVRVQVRGGLGADEGVTAAGHRVAAHRDERAVAALAHGDAAHDLEVLAGPAGGARAVEAVAAVLGTPGDAALGAAEAAGVRVDEAGVGPHGGGFDAALGLGAVGHAIAVRVLVEGHAVGEGGGAEGEQEGERQGAHEAEGEEEAVHAVLIGPPHRTDLLWVGSSGGHPGFSTQCPRKRGCRPYGRRVRL